ncbi:MAG: hypothetical protein R6W90_03175 [Ignavibacteriaceae bacterium]
MKLKLHLIITVITALAFTGCLEIKTIININPDGSGTVEETLLMTNEMVEIMAGFAGSFTEDSTGNVEEFSLFNEEEIKNRSDEFGPSIKFVSAEEINADGKEGYKAVYSFSDLNDLHIDQRPGSQISMSPVSQRADEEKEYITFRFEKGDPSVITIDLPEAKPYEDEGKAEEDSTSSEEMDSLSSEEEDSLSTAEADSASFAQFAQLFKDLRISMVVNINGSIIETNASYRNGSDVTLMDINLGELLKDKDKLQELKNIDPTNINDVKEILKNVLGMQMEFNNTVTIKFRPL